MDQEIENQRTYAVIKSNDFIQQSRFNLSVPEQKIIWYLISKIKFDDDEFKYYDFSISDFCKVCNIDARSGGNYELIKTSLQNLADKSMWIETGSKNNKADKIELVRWIDKVILYKQQGVISVRLDEVLKPYLLKLQREYTSLDLSIALAMDRKYAIRLYEILKCYVGLKNKKIVFELDDLKEKLSAKNYTRFYDFRKHILDNALEEINELADFIVKYEPIKKGRVCTAIEFKFKYKNVRQNYDAMKKIEVKLTPTEEQISFS